MYSEHVREFGGQPTVDFNDESDWQGASKTYRLREDWEDETSNADRLTKLLKQPDSSQLETLIIGAWTSAGEGDDSSAAIKMLVDNCEQLPNLKSLFLGELTYEECEISWINQSDISPLLNVFPQLEELRVRGGGGLAFSKVQHDKLRSLAIETGGLERRVLRELFQCSFPNLEHIELLTGDGNYGFDATPEDFQPLLAGDLFPKLTYLGLMNCEIADDLAAVVVNAPIIDQIKTLDLSMGNISNQGVNALTVLAEKENLQQVNISNHYATGTVVEELRALLHCELIAEPSNEIDEEEDWRPVLHAE